MVAMDLHPAPLHRQTPEHHGADQPTPAALVAGQVAAADAPHPCASRGDLPFSLNSRT